MILLKIFGHHFLHKNSLCVLLVLIYSQDDNFNEYFYYLFDTQFLYS